MINKLQKSSLIIATAFAMVMTACDKNRDEIDQLRKELTTEQFKLAVLNASDSSNLIVENFSRDQLAIFKFESGDSLVISSDRILQVNKNPDDWRMQIYFDDETSLSAAMIGELNVTDNNTVLDPFFRCQLCAVVNIDMPVEGKFKVEVMGKPNGGISITKEFERFSTHHELPVLGLYADYLNSVKLTFLSKDGQVRASSTITLQTEALPDNATMNVVTNNYPNPSTALYFSSSKNFGFDAKGEIRWFYKTYGDFQYLFPKLQNGNVIVVGSQQGYNYHSSHFFEVTMLGQIVKEFAVPNFLHHDIIEMPNGNFLAVTNSHPVIYGDGLPEEDAIVEIDRTTGAVVKTWNFNHILDTNRTPLPTARIEDWLHINAVVYNASDNSLIVSGRSQSAIVKIDYATSAIKWILADHNGWAPGFQPYLLRPVNEAGSTVETESIDFWTGGQHSPKVMPNGNLLVYDNGDYRHFYDDPSSAPDSYTRVVEYHINESTRTIRLVRDFNYNKSLYTKYTGSLNYQPELQTSMIGYMFSSTPKVVEISQNNTIMFEADFSANMANYRALKFDLYENVK